MKKLARFAALLLTAVMALTMLAGCSGEFQTNPEAEEAVIKYVNDNYETQDVPLTNNAAMRQQAAQVLAKATEDGKISKKDVAFKYEYTGSASKIEVRVACANETPDADGMFTLKPYTGSNVEDLVDSVMGFDLEYITVFGVSTRVINGKTYVAVAYTAYEL